MLRCYGNDRFNQTCQMVRRTEIHSFWGFCSDSVPCVPLSCMKVILEILILIWTLKVTAEKQTLLETQMETVASAWALETYFYSGCCSWGCGSSNNWDYDWDF